MKTGSEGMEQSLKYLREILAAHVDRDVLGRSIYERLSTYEYETEEAFVEDLTTKESHYLNAILTEAIDYSNQEQDKERARQLSDIYEVLFI